MSGERKRPAGGNPARSPQELAAVLGAMASQVAEPTPRRGRHRAPAADSPPPVPRRRPRHKPRELPPPVDITPPPVDPPGATDATAPPADAPATVDTAAMPGRDSPPATQTQTGGARRMPRTGPTGAARRPNARSATPPPEPPKSNLIAGRLVIPQAAPPTARSLKPPKPAKPRRPSAPGTRLTSRASGRVAEYRSTRRRGESRGRAPLTISRRSVARSDPTPARVRRIRLTLVGLIGAVLMILLLALLGSGGSSPKPKPASHISPASTAPASAPGSTAPGSAATGGSVPTSTGSQATSVPSVAIPPPPAPTKATHKRAGRHHKHHQASASHP